MISVIIPTFNQEKYISKTLDSILAQKCDHPIKIYINDDCSSDRTREIITNYQHKFPTKIDSKLNKKNLGMPENFYDAIERCNGKYIFFCGGDDWWCDEYKVQKQIDLLENNKEIGLVFTDYHICDEQNCIIGKQKCKQINYEDLIRNNSICASTICVRHDMVKEYISEVKPIEKKWKMEDYPLLLWIIQRSCIYHVPQATTVYRILNSSITHTNVLKKRLDFEDTIYQIRYFFNEKKPIISDKNLRLIRDLNKAYLCIVNNNYEEFARMSKNISVVSFKTMIYRLLGSNRVVFNHARNLFIR